jgi:DNA topoisomerase IA
MPVDHTREIVMEMHQVRYFLAVAEELNFTRAAERCNVTQPSLSRAIKLLEEELGGLLFHRERESTHLTDLGHEVVATATVAGGQFQMRHAPQERIVRREIAQAIVEAAQDFEGALSVRVEDKRQGPPKLHDLPSLQKLCSSRFGWPASKTLEVAQETYDGQGKKIITYPCAEVRYLPESLISDVRHSYRFVEVASEGAG